MISHIRHFERYHNFRRQDQFGHMQYAPNWCKYLYVLKILSNDNPINASFIWYIWKYLIKPRYEHVFLAFATTCFKPQSGADGMKFHWRDRFTFALW